MAPPSPSLSSEQVTKTNSSTSSSPNTDDQSLAETMIDDEARCRIGVRTPEDEEKAVAKAEPGPAEAAMIWVEWDGPDDPQNPLNWPDSRKWVVTILGCVYTCIVSVAVTSYSISEASVVRELHVSSELAIVGVTFFTIMFGSAPLVLAPLSELIGRRYMYWITGFFFCIFYIPQALAPNIGVLLFFRLCLGSAGSTAISLVGGTIADVWDKTERGLPMSLFSLGAFAFTGLGATMFSYAEVRYGFRMISWCQFATTGALFVALLFFAKETRASVLLARKASKLRKATGDQRYQSHEFYHRPSLGTMLKTNLTRPVRLLFTEVYVIAITVWISFGWAVLYLCLGSFSIVFSGLYGFSTGPLGLVYLSQVIGPAIGFGIDYFWCDRMYRKNVDKRGPEARLYTAMAGGIIWPVGVGIYCFTANVSIHWIVPLIGATILYIGLFLIYLACFNVLAEAYTLYASSALAAMSFTRNIAGAVFPLFTKQMYDGLGILATGGLVFALAAALSVTPFLLFIYGARLRAKSPFAKQLAKAEREAQEQLEKQKSRVEA